MTLGQSNTFRRQQINLGKPSLSSNVDINLNHRTHEYTLPHITTHTTGRCYSTSISDLRRELQDSTPAVPGTSHTTSKYLIERCYWAQGQFRAIIHSLPSMDWNYFGVKTTPYWDSKCQQCICPASQVFVKHNSQLWHQKACRFLSNTFCLRHDPQTWLLASAQTDLTLKLRSEISLEVSQSLFYLDLGYSKRRVTWLLTASRRRLVGQDDTTWHVLGHI